ncbi:hypothetical protein DBO86_08065 [Pseudomonas indoloxydans]|uniref:Uncharacterized protein n=1 Tax=Ectopseudomonas oleovorans TaxID=301 RepID=A0A2T5PP46_ECTOL|nr:hypothetical protein DBO86_08065 [Pseudomonas indoloxydans]RRW37522.1 hypothetical protein EGJ44_07830 [Pseudomonas oleovorans]
MVVMNSSPHGRISAYIRRIVRKAEHRHLSTSDIHMLIATCLIARGLARRKRIRPCRPWIRFRLGSAPHSASPRMHAHRRRQ